MSTVTFNSNTIPSFVEESTAETITAVRPLAAVTGAELQAPPLIQGGHVRYANLDYGASAPPA